jgi:hypothetical protein
MTERDFVLEPVPQLLEQLPYLDQPETLQSMAQGCTLQTRSSSSGQGLPSYLAGVMMLIDLFCIPPPQVLSHVDQAFHWYTQCTTHGCVLQFCSSSVASHGLPPWAAGNKMLRERLWMPPWHGSLQKSHDFWFLYLKRATFLASLLKLP